MRVVMVTVGLLACGADDAPGGDRPGQDPAPVDHEIVGVGVGTPADYDAECGGGPYERASAALFADAAAAEAWTADEGFDDIELDLSAFEPARDTLLAVQLRCSDGAPEGYGVTVSSSAAATVAVEIARRPGDAPDSTGHEAWFVLLHGQFSAVGEVRVVEGGE
jgi:hypothetical protein